MRAPVTNITTVVKPRGPARAPAARDVGERDVEHAIFSRRRRPGARRPGGSRGREHQQQRCRTSDYDIARVHRLPVAQTWQRAGQHGR